jgi:DNA-binding transcriptional LysR family regulator
MNPRRGHNIPIALLRSFVAISEHGSFTRAAEELNLTQPAISAQIKRLQRLVGGDVFVKKAMGVGLSELGIVVERYARRILALNDQVIAIAGRVPKFETIYLGIQNIFARRVLGDVVNRFQTSNTTNYRFICGSATDMAEKLNSGYVDLAFMLAPTDLRRNLIAGWSEKLVWVRAPQLFPVAEDEPIPFVGREDGFMDRKVLDVLEEHEVPYRIVFNARDFGPIVAAVEAGIGIMISPERFVPESLMVARERILPELPELHAGIFCKEGFDLTRNRALVDAFVSAVQPPQIALKRAARQR